MTAKYSRLASEDPELGQVAFDFTSTHRYSSHSSATNDYRSIFTYSDVDMQLKDDLNISVVKQSIGNRICSFCIIAVCFLLVVITFPLSAWITIKIVSDYERMVVFRLGRLWTVKGPGVTFVIPCIDKIKKVDVRMKAFTVPPMQLLTSDAGIIELGADVYYKITDPVRSVTSVQDLNTQLRGLVRNRMMNSLTKYDLQDLEAKRDENVAKIVVECNNTASKWGTDICRLELSPIKVLQAAKTGASLPGLGGQEGLTQVFQHLAQSLFSSGQGPRSSALPVISESGEAAGAAVGAEDVKLLPQVTPAHLMELVKGVLSESLVRNVDAVYQFTLSGSNGGVFFLDLKHGSGFVGEGPAPVPEPDVTLDLSVVDMQRMFTDQLKPLQAYMSGRLRVSGDLSAAMRLEEVMEKVVNNTTSSSVAGHTVVNI